MKTQIAIIALLSFTMFWSCQEDELCLIGSGTVNTYEIESNEFDKVRILGPVNLRYAQGNTISVTVDAEPEMFQYLDHHVSHNTLQIGYEESIQCFKTAHQVWVNITHPELSTIEADGVTEIVTASPINQPRLIIDATGSIKVNLTGQVDEQIISSTGKLQVKNFDLQSKHTFIDTSGSSDLEINCSETLDIDVDGSSTIYYTGHPVINKNVDGSLRLNDAN